MSNQELGHGPPPPVPTGPAEPTGLTTQDHAAQVAVGSKAAELQAGLVMARQFPRNEGAAVAKLMAAAQRPRFAAEARYTLERGNSSVQGPSVHFAREAARLWGNLRHGLDVISQDAHRCKIRGWAHDLESNTTVAAEDEFAKLVERGRGQNKRWLPANETQLRELIAKRGAILVRNSILQLLPRDVVDNVMDQVARTVHDAAQDEGQSRETAVQSLLAWFREYGVTQGMVEQRLGHGLDTVTNEEIVDLRGVARALKDGVAIVGDYFQTQGRQEPARSVLND